jgi:hypothetical protein
METSAVVMVMFSGLLAAFVSLFGWTLSQTNKLGSQNAATGEVVRGLVARIDVLVQKLDANFSIQISEQVARNVLQEKVKNLEEDLRRARHDRRGRDSEPREENGI